MKINLVSLLIVVLLLVIALFAQPNIGAMLDVAQVFTAQQSTNVSLAAADSSGKFATTSFVVPGSTTSASCPIADPGDTFDFVYNNSSGACTFSAPAGIKGLERCYRNATGQSGVITVQMAANNTADLVGANTSSGGTLVSNGALGDSICMASDTTNHWYATAGNGTWTAH